MCDPDYNAWTNSKNTIDSNFTQLRSCGGHLHIGYNEPNKHINLQIIRLLDLFLGVPSVLLDKDIERKMLYGKAGAFRAQKYGVEYRVLSNFWVNNLELINWVFGNAFEALKAYNRGLEFTEEEGTLIQNCINQNDIVRAEYIIEKYGILMPKDYTKLNKIKKSLKQQ